MPPELTTEEKALLEEVRESFEAAEQYLKPFRDSCDHLYSLYRGHQELRANMRRASPPDRDTLLRDAKGTWGAELFIPISFSTIETVLPRAISHRPRMQLTPRDETANANIENMKVLIDQQQEQIDYENRLEETGKSGFIYGLGVQKGPWWEKRYSMKRGLKERLAVDTTTQTMRPTWVETAPERTCTFDDWTAEDIDVADFFWDPFGYDMRSVGWVIHRTWRKTKYVKERIARGDWNTAAAKALEDKDIEGMAGGQKYDEAFEGRMRAAGHTDFKSRGNQLHEVWEFHDGERMITVLDRQIPVLAAGNPAWHGEIPFAVFRPTTAGIKQLHGIGLIEPIEHLQREVNTLRSQRRDNAALKLMQVFAFNDGVIEPGDLKFFPGAAIPVNGEPRDMLYPINVGDIPNSGYQEEANLVADIERTTGISDTVTGAEGGGGQTATGVQLVQAAAGVRIQKQSRRMELELITRQARQAVALNQQRIVSPRPVPVKPAPTPGRLDPAWENRMLGPAELNGQFSIKPLGGSISPDSVAQKRQDAQFKLNLLGQNPNVDQRALLVSVADDLGFPNPEAIMAPEQPSLNPEVLSALKRLGVEDEKLQMAVEAVQQAEQQQ